MSRVFKELGLPGVLLLGIGGILFLQSLVIALKSTPGGHTAADLQLCLLSAVAGNAACFSASHQVYSGDPSSSLYVLLLLGIVFGVPRIFWSERTRLAGAEGRTPFLRSAPSS